LDTLIILNLDNIMEENTDLPKNNPYGLTKEKLIDTIEAVFNSEPIKSNLDYIDRLYQSMTPKGRELFDEAIKAEANGWKVKEPVIVKNKPIIPQLDTKVTSTGKIRKKNTHLKPKKKPKK